MGRINEIAATCSDRNTTIKAMLSRKEGTLLDLIDEQVELLKDNNSIIPRQSGEDVYEAVRETCRGTFDEEFIERICNNLKYRVINTANHMGGVYSPQSFQGDILFCSLLHRMGEKSVVAPIPASTTVPMTNSANLRYMVLFNEGPKPYKLVLSENKDKKTISGRAKALDRERVAAVLEQVRKDYPNKKGTKTSNPVEEFFKAVYLNDSLLKKERFADQIKMVEKKVSEMIFGENPSFAYLDLEGISTYLVKKDIKSPESLVYKLIYDKACTKAINLKLEGENEALAGYLFKAVDRKKRAVPLMLGEDGVLRGKVIGGDEVEYSASPESLEALLNEGIIYPAIGTCLISLMFERGFTWLGGVFQSEYLPRFQKMVANVFHYAGFTDISEYIKRWKCNGYISGPIFLLASNGKNLLNNAGPYECVRGGITWEKTMEIISRTTIADGHYMGLFEFYNDITTTEEKCENWYQIISDYCGKKYQSNMLYGGLNVY